MRTRALGILLGYAADRLLGDPAAPPGRRLRPAGVAPRAATPRRRPRPRRRARRLLVGGAAGIGSVAERATRGHPSLTCGDRGRDLGGARRHARWTARRQRSPSTAGAEPTCRTHASGSPTWSAATPAPSTRREIARATIESVAENTSDAVVAPLRARARSPGVPGLLGYRAANTLDAMVGHRSARYERFGWAAARLDDLLNLPGSRLTAAARGRCSATTPGRASRAWRRDAAGHPSPNAGPVEAAFAGALGVRLGGVNVYGVRVEDRQVLGDGRAPAQHDITRARSLARRVGAAAAGVAVRHRAATQSSAALDVGRPSRRRPAPAGDVRRRPGRRAAAAASIFGQV